MKRLTFLIAMIAFTVPFSGCGQSGPLYVPGNPSQMAVPPSRDTVSEEDEEEQDSSSDSSETD
jgi:predicted small lipoprotein YifL